MVCVRECVFSSVLVCLESVCKREGDKLCSIRFGRMFFGFMAKPIVNFGNAHMGFLE